MDNKFNEEDKEKVVQFLNIIAKNANFNLNTAQIIEYFKLLSFMQQTLIPKIDDNIMELKKIIEDSKEE